MLLKSTDNIYMIRLGSCWINTNEYILLQLSKQQRDIYGKVGIRNRTRFRSFRIVKLIKR